MGFFSWPQNLLGERFRAAQGRRIGRKWSLGTIYDGSMRWPDRLAICAENDRSTSGESVEQMWRADTPQNPSGASYRTTTKNTQNQLLRSFFTVLDLILIWSISAPTESICDSDGVFRTYSASSVDCAWFWVPAKWSGRGCHLDTSNLQKKSCFFWKARTR